MGSNFGGNVGRTEPSLWDYVLRVPPVVRYYFAGSLLVTFLWHFQIIPSEPVILQWRSVFNNYNIPPLVLSFFHWGPISRDRVFELIFMVMTLFRQGAYLEQSIFSGDPAEFVFCLIFCGLMILVQDFFFQSYVLAKCLIMAILQIWVRHNPTQEVRVIFITLRAFYLPLVMLGADFVFSGGKFPFLTLKGLLAGHMYYFLTEVTKQFCLAHDSVSAVTLPQSYLEPFVSRLCQDFPGIRTSCMHRSGSRGCSNKPPRLGSPR
mmetsp:Transcript_22872/g.91530  ORF Transcript_22872/g.91530 Transcript_22872/m.91530 type:complete len:263 (-) Transcript_22872:188-976(-)